MAGKLGFTLVISVPICCLSVHIFFPGVNINGFSPNLVCALIYIEIWFGIANRQISSIFDSHSSATG